MTTSSGADERLFYGWYVVLGVFLMLTLSSGLGFYNLAVLLEALTSQRGLSVGVASGAIASFFLGAGLAGLAVGSLIERFDPRYTIGAGALVSALALVAIGRTEEAPRLYALFAVFGAGFSGSALIPATTLVTRWFHRRRSVALAASASGLSAGGILITPLSARLIHDVGLTEATVWLGLAYLLGVVPITSLLLRRDPKSMGLQPDGAVRPVGARSPTLDGASFKEALRSRLFPWLAVTYMVGQLAQVGGIAHVFNVVSERAGYGLAGTAIQLLALSSFVGRLAGGWALSLFSIRAFTLAFFALQAISLLGIGLADGTVPLLVGVSLFGAAVGNVLMLQPLILAQAFGVQAFARIYSVSQLVTTLGIAIGPALLGVVHDLSHSYAAAYSVASAATIVAVATLVAAGPVRSYR